MSEDDFQDKWTARVKKLNSDPKFQLMEVGESGTLVGGDVVLSKGPDDKFEAVIKGVKPGIWTITLSRNESDDFKQCLLRWVAPGPLDFEHLPTNLSEPNFASLDPWKRVGRFSVDGGVFGLFDKNSLDQLIEEQEENDKQYIMEVIADFATDNVGVACQVGCVVGGDDGGYKIMGRSHDGAIVEVAIEPNSSDDAEE